METIESGRHAGIVLVVLMLSLVSGCRPSEPLPDHFGLFGVQEQNLHELVRQDPNDPSVRSLDENLDSFFSVFSGASILDTPPDYLILYDQQFTPGALHVTKMTPTWARAAFTATTEEIPLQVQPLDKPGMYRLRPQQPFKPGFYIVRGVGSSSVGDNGYFSALCAQCARDETHAALEKIRTEEAARLSAATNPTRALIQSNIAFWYGPWPQSLNWTVLVSDTDIRWSGYNKATIGYSEIQSVDLIEAQGPWGGILCLNLPPRVTDCRNTVQVSTIKVPEEIPKLREVAEVAQAALAAWKQKYPNGLPYAVPEEGGN